MAAPRALIFSGYGLNCEEETSFAFEAADAQVDIVHINDLIEQPNRLDKYQIMALPGGFSYGDDTGSGKAFANKLRNHLWEKLATFAAGDHLIIGICNGFQILSNLGLLPASEGDYGQRQIALTPNNSARYTVRWIDLEIKNASPWLKDLKKLSLPIAHGEGRLFSSEATLATIKQNNQIALEYVTGEMCAYQQLPANPNGSQNNIAGISDKSGRILGLMPHPERAIHFTQLPNWPWLSQKFKRSGSAIPSFGPGIELFYNAVNYFH